MDLSQLRQQIDTIDRQIVNLYEERMDVSRQVAEYKIETGKKVFDKQREQEKIAGVCQHSCDPDCCGIFHRYRHRIRPGACHQGSKLKPHRRTSQKLTIPQSAQQKPIPSYA